MSDKEIGHTIEIPCDLLPAINYAMMVYDRSLVDSDDFDHEDVKDRLKGNYVGVFESQTGGVIQDVEEDSFEVFAMREDVLNMRDMLSAAKEEADVNSPRLAEPFDEALSYIERNYL